MLKEFKEFISKGSVFDMAVGIIIGGAVGKIVSSLVNDILMPAIGVLLGGINVESLNITVFDATVNYGLFIQSIIDFLIIAFCLFLIIKLINKLKRKKDETPEPPSPSKEEILLTEIRDLLKKR